MIAYLLTFIFTLYVTAFRGPEYKIEAIRYATIPQFQVAGLVAGASEDEKLDIPLLFKRFPGNDRIVVIK